MFPESGRHGPFVIGQLGQSLDGRIALENGASRDINRKCALDHLHRLRAEVDAVVVGVGTVLADDPQLTVRRVDGVDPARVVIDPNNRLPVRARCLSGDDTRICIFTHARRSDLPNVDFIELPREGIAINPLGMLAALEARGFRRILVEGGARTLSLFLQAGCIDRLHILVRPMIIGSGKSGLNLAPINELHMALYPKTKVSVFGDGDVLFDCDLRVSDMGDAIHAED